MEALSTRYSFHNTYRSPKYTILHDTHKDHRQENEMGKSLSQFHFHIAHALGNNNVVANALSKRPIINVVSIAHLQDLISMIGQYMHGEGYAQLVQDLENGKAHEPFSLKEGFLLHNSRLCITKRKRSCKNPITHSM